MFSFSQQRLGSDWVLRLGFSYSAVNDVSQEKSASSSLVQERPKGKAKQG